MAFLRVLVILMTCALAVPAQVAAPPKPSDSKVAAARSRRSVAKKPDPRRQFVMDVVQTAVALPVSNPQDRLRVLNSATMVSAPVAPQTARQLAREGAQLEQELVGRGETPAVSILSSGYVPCATVKDFVDSLTVESLAVAEESLMGALSVCPRQVADTARLKIETGLNRGVIAARPLLALMEQTGPKTQWSQTQFRRMFTSLPRDAAAYREAANFAAMYVRMAPELDKDVARQTGVAFLEWLAKVEEGGERNLAVTMTLDTMRSIFDEKEMEDALASSIIAQQMARTAGPGEIQHQEYESASVLEAMGNVGSDRTEQLRGLPPSQRAREAAAHGFASGTNGERQMAERYFDMAFSAVDEFWSERGSNDEAAAVVEEVSEAAAHVDAVAALVRTQKLDEPSAQAIGMLAVARVVLGQAEDQPR
jgi:hypothetical protein